MLAAKTAGIFCMDFGYNYSRQPSDLRETAKALDDTLNAYLDEYQKINLQIKRYPNIDTFIKDYLQDFC